MTNNLYIDTVAALRSSGHCFLASTAISHYEKFITGLPVEEHWRVSDMFDEVLETALIQQKEVTPEDVIASPDFTFIRALALLLLKFNLVEEDVDLSDLEDGALDSSL